MARPPDTPGPPDAPERIELDLEEAERLFAALEDAADLLNRLVGRQTLKVLDVIGPLAAIDYQLAVLARKLGYAEGE